MNGDKRLVYVLKLEVKERHGENDLCTVFGKLDDGQSVALDIIEPTYRLYFKHRRRELLSDDELTALVQHHLSVPLKEFQLGKTLKVIGDSYLGDVPEEFWYIETRKRSVVNEARKKLPTSTFQTFTDNCTAIDNLVLARNVNIRGVGWHLFRLQECNTLCKCEWWSCITHVHASVIGAECIEPLEETISRRPPPLNILLIHVSSYPNGIVAEVKACLVRWTSELVYLATQVFCNDNTVVYRHQKQNEIVGRAYSFRDEDSLLQSLCKFVSACDYDFICGYSLERDQLTTLRERGDACGIKLIDALLIRDRRHRRWPSQTKNAGLGIGLIDIQSDGKMRVFGSLCDVLFKQGVLHAYLSVCEAASIFCCRLNHDNMHADAIQVPYVQFFESAMSRKAKQLGYVFTETQDVKTTDRDVEECNRGGLFLDSVQGLHIGDADLRDFKSMYGSIITTYNIDITTAVQPSTCQTDACNVLPNGSCFVKASVRQGLLPSIVKQLMQERCHYQQLASNEKDGYNCAWYDVQQKARKLLIVGAFGVNFRRSIFTSENIALAITATGRFLLEKMRDVTTSFRHPLLSTVVSPRIIFGHADSLMTLLTPANHKLSDEEWSDVFRDIDTYYHKVLREATTMRDANCLQFESKGHAKLLLCTSRKQQYAARMKSSHSRGYELVVKGFPSCAKSCVPLVKKIELAILSLLFGGHVLLRSSETAPVYTKHPNDLINQQLISCEIFIASIGVWSKLKSVRREDTTITTYYMENDAKEVLTVRVMDDNDIPVLDGARLREIRFEMETVVLHELHRLVQGQQDVSLLLKRLSPNANPEWRQKLDQQYKQLQKSIPCNVFYLNTIEEGPMHPLLAVFQQKTIDIKCTIEALKTAFVESVTDSSSITDAMYCKVKTLHGVMCTETESTVRKQKQVMRQFRNRFDAIAQSDTNETLGTLQQQHKILAEFNDCTDCKVLQITCNTREYNYHDVFGTDDCIRKNNLVLFNLLSKTCHTYYIANCHDVHCQGVYKFVSLVNNLKRMHKTQKKMRLMQEITSALIGRSPGNTH